MYKEALMSVLSHNWNNPPDEDLLTLAKVITKYLRFFDPTIINAIASDNHTHASTSGTVLPAASQVCGATAAPLKKTCTSISKIPRTIRIWWNELNEQKESL
jgi:hypothetical protein